MKPFYDRIIVERLQFGYTAMFARSARQIYLVTGNNR